MEGAALRRRAPKATALPPARLAGACAASAREASKELEACISSETPPSGRPEGTCTPIVPWPSITPEAYVALVREVSAGCTFRDQESSTPALGKKEKAMLACSPAIVEGPVVKVQSRRCQPPTGTSTL